MLVFNSSNYSPLVLLFNTHCCKKQTLIKWEREEDKMQLKGREKPAQGCGIEEKTAFW